jgi:hypothetical protein
LTLGLRNFVSGMICLLGDHCMAITHRTPGTLMANPARPAPLVPSRDFVQQAQTIVRRNLKENRGHKTIDRRPALA